MTHIKVVLHCPARNLRSSGKKLRDGLRASNELKREINVLERAVQERDSALGAAKGQLEGLSAELKVVGEQRDQAVQELEQVGDSRGVAAGIRRDIERLRSFSRMPKVPTGTAGSGGNR